MQTTFGENSQRRLHQRLHYSEVSPRVFRTYPWITYASFLVAPCPCILCNATCPQHKANRKWTGDLQTYPCPGFSYTRVLSAHRCYADVRNILQRVLEREASNDDRSFLESVKPKPLILPLPTENSYTMLSGQYVYICNASYLCGAMHTCQCVTLLHISFGFGILLLPPSS